MKEKGESGEGITSYEEGRRRKVRQWELEDQQGR